MLNERIAHYVKNMLTVMRIIFLNMMFVSNMNYFALFKIWTYLQRSIFGWKRDVFTSLDIACKNTVLPCSPHDMV